MKLLYIGTKGTDDATLASVPLHLAANDSLEIGQEVSVVLAGDATEQVIGDNARSTEGISVPPLCEHLSKLMEHRVPVYI
jgi:predicted peroxiredoxin